jgi:NCAIR mutase (PurE)-related protein
MSQRKINSLLRRAEKIQAQIEETKQLYSELDDIIAELRSLKFKSNRKAVIIDNFKSKSTTFKTVAFTRYRLEIFS